MKDDDKNMLLNAEWIAWMRKLLIENEGWWFIKDGIEDQKHRDNVNA